MNEVLTAETAAAYIIAKHAGHGTCTVEATRETAIDGTPVIIVDFTFNGHPDRADVWIEGGTVYGEW